MQVQALSIQRSARLHVDIRMKQRARAVKHLELELINLKLSFPSTIQLWTGSIDKKLKVNKPHITSSGKRQIEKRIFGRRLFILVTHDQNFSQISINI